MQTHKNIKLNPVKLSIITVSSSRYAQKQKGNSVVDDSGQIAIDSLLLSTIGIGSYCYVRMWRVVCGVCGVCGGVCVFGCVCVCRLSGCDNQIFH